MGGGTETVIIEGGLPRPARQRRMNPFSYIKRAETILQNNGFQNLLEVGVAVDSKGLILIGDFPLNGETAQAYLEAKSQILLETNLDVLAYERIKNNRVYVTPV